MVGKNSAKPHSEPPKLKWHKSSIWLLTPPLVLLMLTLAWSNISRMRGDTNEVLRKLSLTYPVGPVIISPNGEMVAAGEGHVTAQVRVWDFQTSRLLYSIKTNHTSGVGLIAFSPDNRTIATSDLQDGNQLFLWDVKNGKRKGQLIGAQWLTNSLFFSPDGAFLINAGRNRNATVEIWDVATGRLLRTLTESPTGSAFAFPMSDSKTMLVVSNSGVKLRDLRTYQLLRSFSSSGSNTKEYLNAALSPDEKTLAVGTRNSQGSAEFIELWDVQRGRRRLLLPENIGNRKAPQNSLLQSLAFSPDSEVIASSSSGEPVKLWDTRTGLIVNTLKSEAHSLAFSPDGKTLAVGAQREVHLWKVDALLKGGGQ